MMMERDEKCGRRCYTSTRAPSFCEKAPTMEGETPTSLAPAIMAASVHPNLALKKENVIGIQLLNQNKHYMNIEVSKQGEKGKIKRTNKKNIQPL